MTEIKKYIEEIIHNQNWDSINKLFDSEYEKFYSKLNKEDRLRGFLNYKELLRKRLKTDLRDKIILKVLNGENNYNIKDEIKYLLAPLISVVEMYHQYYNKEISNLENAKKAIELGKKLSGKQVSNDRLKAYKIIFEKDFQNVSNGGKSNFRSLCYYVAKTELGYSTEKEKESFYKSFSKFKKDNKIVGLLSFEKYLSTKGKLI